ncbi:MAG: hypothetical protein DI629_16515 [Mesorhizobium amorphae]|nr:MAG: hypothetical protein DI629_16515 [Mesorhizobium amorphae]
MQSGLNPAPGFQKNPGKRITIEPYPGTVTVSLGDAVIASSKDAKLLREGDYPAIFYIPFKDIYFEHLEKTASSTHCPYKGDASYWRVQAVGEAVDDAMWAYETPYDEMALIREHGAFYPDKLRIEAGE